MGDNSTSTSPTQVTSGCYIDHALYMKIESVSEDATSTAGSLSEWWVYEPTSPSKSRRYSRNRTIKNGTPALLIKPLSKSLTQDCKKLPQGWQRYVHPEGLPYFSRPPSDICSMRVVTDDWLYDSEISDVIDSAIEGIKGMCDGKIPQMPDDPGDNDLFVDLCRDEDGKLSRDEDGRPHCRYYFVNHSKRCIYWAEEVTLHYELSPLLYNVRGELSEYQAEICLETEYWWNWYNFPNLQNKELDTYNYVVESLLDAMTDVAVSDSSVLEYTYEELQKRMEVVQVGKDFKSSNWHIGRFMLEISYGRLENYYGTRCARLSMSQSVLEENEPKNCSIFLNAMSPLLFFIPHVQLHRLETLGTTVDGTVLVTRQWNKLFDQLQGEWTQTILIATIILAANCAFLAIPLFQGSEFMDTHSSPEQVASYVSLTTSLFGLLLGTLMYQHQKNRRTSNPILTSMGKM
ncbi:hypothetical protein Agabi119p4_7155 [Agaricus bisporus var. burnettii]|uniref:Uncharacterized protein n=1 Tax=Agaricus bisporus var. burnettii TaxID=192524 RepID=A0A8H7C731_AGABI|nr:hypothetical protein Agabi119p4_7155 [Agaricus bisporus var. burnettii]